MAIQKLINLPNGTSGDYLYIKEVIINPQTLAAKFIVLLYKDNTFQPPNPYYINVYEIDMTAAQFYACLETGGALVTVDQTNLQILSQLFAKAYAWMILNVPEFEGGTLVP